MLVYNTSLIVKSYPETLSTKVSSKWHRCRRAIELTLFFNFIWKN